MEVSNFYCTDNLLKSYWVQIFLSGALCTAWYSVKITLGKVTPP